MKVRIISVCNLLEELFPGYWEDMNFLKYSYDETGAAILQWCKDNDAHYYGRPKEDFFEWEAVQEAEEMGLDTVVVENYS